MRKRFSQQILRICLGYDSASGFCVFINLSITEGCDRHMSHSYMLSIKEERNTVVFQRKEQSHLFVVGAQLSLRGHMVISSQSALGEESMEGLGDHTSILCGYVGLGVMEVDITKAS